jgi:hypothetical protein
MKGRKQPLVEENTVQDGVLFVAKKTVWDGVLEFLPESP